MTFTEKLKTAVEYNKSLLCVGIDPDFNKLPDHIKIVEKPLFEFSKAIIDATAEVVCVYKPNSAFFESYGALGIEQLKETCDYIRENYPRIPIILDAKRADIGNTNNGYTKFAFDYLGVDAITLHPYLGGESLIPFLDHKDKGLIVLCRTSNPGASEFQDLLVENELLYQYVAKQVATSWNTNKNAMLVVGATYPREMKIIREIVGPEMIFLVPGIGAQGGDIEEVMRAGLNPNGQGLMISSSREILYASSGQDFAVAAKAKALATRDEINKYR
jgi:orotidine-5'-phosphate decarboxylase